jgi:hypothetical protein
MWTVKFWKQATERALKTAAQSLLVMVGGDGAGLVTLNPKLALFALAGGLVASYLFSIVSLPLGEPDSPSVVQE